MKNYEKPRLMFLSLNGNDQLCGTCAENNRATINDNKTYQDMILFAYPEVDENRDNILDREEFDKCFGTAEDECVNMEYKIDSYCKFTSTTNLVAWS